MRNIETKVVAAAAGGGVGGALGPFILWLLGVLVWHVSDAADSASQAMAAVPTPIAALILAGLPAGLAWAAGYRAPHTARIVEADLLPPVPPQGILPVAKDLPPK